MMSRFLILIMGLSLATLGPLPSASATEPGAAETASDPFEALRGAVKVQRGSLEGEGAATTLVVHEAAGLRIPARERPKVTLRAPRKPVCEALPLTAKGAVAWWVFEGARPVALSLDEEAATLWRKHATRDCFERWPMVAPTWCDDEVTPRGKLVGSIPLGEGDEQLAVPLEVAGEGGARVPLEMTLSHPTFQALEGLTKADGPMAGARLIEEALDGGLNDAVVGEIWAYQKDGGQTQLLLKVSASAMDDERVATNGRHVDRTSLRVWSPELKVFRVLYEHERADDTDEGFMESYWSVDQRRVCNAPLESPTGEAFLSHVQVSHLDESDITESRLDPEDETSRLDCTTEEKKSATAASWILDFEDVTFLLAHHPKVEAVNRSQNGDGCTPSP